MAAGDVIEVATGGGGGYGDPLERPPAAVRSDVRDGYISRETAREAYGVVLSGEPPAVDEAATADRRASMRAERGDRPEVDRGD
jgi:N-methylhydantoinase B